MIDKYLTTWAEDEARTLPSLPAELGSFEHGVAIVAFAEGTRLLDAVQTVPLHPPCVVVCVVNAPADARPEQLALNSASIDLLATNYDEIMPLENGSVRSFGGGALIVIQAAVSRKHGVGKARKIGLDVLLTLWSRRRLKDTWLHTTDADVRLAADYFVVAPNRGGGTSKCAASGLIHPWHHVADTVDLVESSRLYELRLRHHAAGLAHAGSPYAFATIGSTMAVDVWAYAAVRGVPRRPAAEDFYFLNKLAKVGAITHGGGAVQIAGRVSDRVPFGTGASLGKAALGVEPQCYAPLLFDWLKLVVKALNDAVDGSTPLGIAHPDSRFHAGVEQRKLVAMIARINASGLPLEQRRRRLYETFDAFGTLKLMHAWRTQGLADVAVDQALSESPWFEHSSDDC